MDKLLQLSGTAFEVGRFVEVVDTAGTKERKKWGFAGIARVLVVLLVDTSLQEQLEIRVVVAGLVEEQPPVVEQLVEVEEL